MNYKPKEPKDFVKAALWRRGFRVLDTRNTNDYDLLLEGKVKIKVMHAPVEDSYFYQTTGCDAIALYISGGKKGRMFFYCMAGETKENMRTFGEFKTNPKEVFGKPSKESATTKN